MTANVQLVGAGLGQTFAQYKCNPTICYGTDGGPTHALFKEFQYQLNRAGKALSSSWRSIGVDGFIGAETVKAYNAVAAATQVPGTYERLPLTSGHVDLAAKVRNQDLTGAVADLAMDAGAAGESAAAIEARAAAAVKQGSTTTEATPVRYDGTPVTLPSGRSKVGLMVGVTAGLAAIGLVGVAVLQKRRRRR